MKRFVIVLLLVLPSLALAQAKPASREMQSPLSWSVDLMINNYVRALSANYKLSPEQEEYTRSLLAQRVKRFLSDNEKEVRYLAAEMLDYRMKGQMPPPEIAKVWGDQIKQMLPAVRAEVMEGNMKWRDVLNDDQKKMHDRDLKALDEQFEHFDKVIDRWSNGDYSPTDLDQPGQVTRLPKTMTIRPSEDAWEFFVRRFIQMYNLDEGQQQSANSILRESKEQALHYRDAHKAEFADLDAADKAAAQGSVKTDPEELKKVKEASKQRLDKRRELEKPISELFTKLKTRMEDLPTAEQRKGQEQRVAKLAALGKRSTSRPAVVAVSTQPSTASAEAPTSAPAADASTPTP